MRKRGQRRTGTKKSALDVPKTIEEYRARSERFQDTWTRVTHVVTKMRADNVSLSEASREYGLNSRTVIRLGGSALRKRRNGQYVAKAADSRLRVLVILTDRGLGEIAIQDSREASQLAKYWDAVHKYLETGDSSAIRKIRRKYIKDANGRRVLLLKDLDELSRLGSAGVFSFESLYARAA